MNILVTGGSGYIGSHTVIELLGAGHEVTVVDNLCNSSLKALERVKQITNRDVSFYKCDIGDEENLNIVFSECQFDAVIHFAGLKAVGESVSDPLRYYQNNVAATITLCKVMQKHNVKQIVFSSSATVYGLQDTPKYTENMDIRPFNPYGRTKAMVEQVLQDLVNTEGGWRISLLRYFNPIGAHQSGLIGDDPEGVPNNLFPFVTQVAVGKMKELAVFGGDYETNDGTGVRDYIHVVDLAKGHLAALEHTPEANHCESYNLGSGEGASVLEVIQAFEKVTGIHIPYKIADRRPGDLPIYYADPAKAMKELSWKTEKSLEDACADAWRWQSSNPNGYR